MYGSNFSRDIREFYSLKVAGKQIFDTSLSCYIRHINKMSVASISPLMKSLFINEEYPTSARCNESDRHVVKKE